MAAVTAAGTAMAMARQHTQAAAASVGLATGAFPAAGAGPAVTDAAGAAAVAAAADDAGAAEAAGWTDRDPLRATAAAWLAAGRPAIELQVRHARGSVPRGAGTRMLVAADAVAGTIGGGHLELQAITAARAQLAAAASGGAQGAGVPAASGAFSALGAAGAAGMAAAAVVDQHIALGPSLGQCCGGALLLRRQPLSAATLAGWPAPQPLFTLQLFGAGHVGRAISRLLADIDCRVQWVDERAAEFPAEASPPHVQRLCTDGVAGEVMRAPPGAFYLVLTHSHALDLAITQAVLQRADFGYLGLIGSATKRARFVHRFESRGIAADSLARLTCPIGVPGIPGKQPEHIALAVVAQLLQVAARLSPG